MNLTSSVKTAEFENKDLSLAIFISIFSVIALYL
jgi:hypothetical protein